MMPFICFKMEPSENKFHHQGLSYTKLCRGVFVSTCVSVCASARAGFGDLTSKEFGHMVVNTKSKERASEPRKEKCLLLSVKAERKAA